MGAEITHIEYYLPDFILTNEALSSEFPEWDSEKIAEKIGIRQRHIVNSSETAFDLAFNAAEKVLKGFDKEKIDFVLLCTQSPDYFLPTTACILQDKLGLRKDIGALDYNLGCSGFIYGLALAKGLINSNIAQNILLITAETYSKHINIKDKANRSIFGDGAAACIISKCDSEKIFDFELGTDGSGKENLIVKNGGLRAPFNATDVDVYDDGNFVNNNNNLFMNGPEIFNFTISNIPGLVNRVLQKHQLSIETIDYVIFHQANKYMLDYLRKKVKIVPEKFYQNMENTGNTVSATIPIALKNCIDQNLVKPGNKILLCGFGVGYSWGATIIEL